MKVLIEFSKVKIEFELIVDICSDFGDSRGYFKFENMINTSKDLQYFKLYSYKFMNSKEYIYIYIEYYLIKIWL
jgi:hypothetical protein